MAEEPQAPQTETTETPETTEPTEVTFTQSDLDREADRRVAKALEKQKADMQAEIEAAKSEGERLAKMSADEKAAEEAKAKMDALTQREQAVKQKELSLATRALLSDSGLPDDLADSLTVLGDADAIKQAVETLKATVDDGIRQGIQANARTTAPSNGSSTLKDADDPFQVILKQYEK
ncbi:scaffold protein [Lactobacillus phage Sabazios]|nr:scaffold protein [Lactobacillus phage Sabazios]